MEKTIPLLVADRLPYSVGMHVVGISSTSYTTRTTDQQTRSFSRFSGCREPILIDIGGQSDLLDGLTAEQILTAMESYHNAAKTSGAVRTIVSTIPPMTEAWDYTTLMETQRLVLNDLILASDVWDAVADLASLPESEDPDDTDYFADGLHPTGVLAALFADEIVSRI